MMKITYVVANDGNPEGWEETIDHDGGGWPSDVIKALVDRYNASIPTRGGKPRRFVRIVSTEPSTPKPLVVEHRWTKTSLVTESRGRRTFDRMRCEACGATGKRYGLGQFGVTLDAKCDKPKFRNCPGER